MTDAVFVNPEPYCDVCGNAGKDLRTPVEVCRDCYDIAKDPTIGRQTLPVSAHA